MMNEYEFENYLKKSLSNSISSQNPSNEVKNKARKLSPSYFNDLKEKLLMKYEDKSLKDVMDCRSCRTSYGDVLKITKKEKINFNTHHHHLLPFAEELYRGHRRRGEITDREISLKKFGISW